MIVRSALALVLSLWLSLSPQMAGAQAGANIDPVTTDRMLSQWDVEASAIEVLLDHDPPDINEIPTLGETLKMQLDAAPKIIAGAETHLVPLRQQLEALGPSPEDEMLETAELAEQRRKLTDQVAAFEALQKRSGQAEVRAKALTERLLNRRRQLFTDELVTRGPSLFTSDLPRRAFSSISLLVNRIYRETSKRLEAHRMDSSSLTSLGGLAFVMVVGLVFLFRTRRALVARMVAQVTDETPYSRRVLLATGITLTRLLVPACSLVLVLFVAWASGLLGRTGGELLRGLARAAALVIGAYALGGAFFAPRAPQLRLSILDNASARSAHAWLVLLALIVGLDNALIVDGSRIWLGLEALTLINIVLLILGGVTLWQLVKTISQGSPRPLPATPEDAVPDEQPQEPEDADLADEPPAVQSSRPIISRLVRTILLFAAIASPILAIAGYYAASRHLFYPVVYSSALVGLNILLFHVVYELIDKVIATDKSDDGKKPLRLIPLIVGFFLACGAVPVLALIWGASVQDLNAVWRQIVVGFTIGDVVISPIDFFAFLIVFSIGYIITRVAQRALTNQVLPLTGLDAGGRAAARAGVGYVGIGIAALIAISTTGLDLSNLAIVAGALSVGIGFGLQNIVNNFVSGIILLIERPIKAGDWVELPSGMGYVKQVNVRSTEIETFDRAALIVPNSELISSSVINWTHGNLHGRVIVPVGVAYGTDTRKVERILLEVAKAHPMIQRRPAPWVNFKGFGDSSMDFEIRGVLRDVNWVLNVMTDLNHEIASRFAQEGIEIPFPQRDINLRTPISLKDTAPNPAVPESPKADPSEDQA